jgi:hypothetical protein
MINTPNNASGVFYCAEPEEYAFFFTEKLRSVVNQLSVTLKGAMDI